MNLADLGKWIAVTGIVLVLLGGFLWLMDRVPWFGNLPGDIHIQQGNFGCILPLTTMIIVSVLATIILNIVIRILNK